MVRLSPTELVPCPAHAQKKASANYAKKMTKCVNLAFNKKTDADILEKLDQVDSKMGYIKKLIREDIAKSEKD